MLAESTLAYNKKMLTFLIEKHSSLFIEIEKHSSLVFDILIKKVKLT
jgi:hypothetical protein